MTSVIDKPNVSVEADTPTPLVVVSETLVRFENVLERGEVPVLLDAVSKARDRFQPATVTDGRSDVRSAEVIFDAGLVCADFQLSLEACMPVVERLFPELGDSWTSEIQVTAHGDGDYFGLHNDAGSPATAARRVSFVYYFSAEPVRFSGGDLVIYDSPVDRPDLVSPTKHIVQPVCNTMVFFRSAAWHEVLPVSCPSSDFSARRFTINGWLTPISPSTSRGDRQ